MLKFALNKIKMRIGYKIKNYRDLKKLTQSELGILIGKSQSQIGEYESETTQPSIKTLEKIAKELEVPISDFFDSEKYLQYNSNNKNVVNHLTLNLSSKEDIEKLKEVLNSFD